MAGKISIFLFLIFCVIVLSASNSFGQDKLSETEIDSLVNAGKKQLALKNWLDAMDCFDEIIEHDPDNLIGNYYYAICQREKGAHSDPLSRLFRWKSAKNHFEHVIELDSTFSDVFYQYAIMELYRDNYFDAAEMTRHQLEINNVGTAQIGIFHVYDVMLHHESNEAAEEWLKSRNSDFDKYILGELYRRTEQFDKAEEIFNSIISGNKIPLVPVYLSLVKLLIQEDDQQKAADTYWDAVNSIKDSVGGKLLLKDLIYILNENDYKVYKNLKSVENIKQFVKSFWFVRNPYPSMPYNMYLVEYYKRIIYVDENYWYDGLRMEIYDPNKLDVINHPPWYDLNDRYNDLGIVYLRLGEPNGMSGITTFGRWEIVSWLYNETANAPKMIVNFEVDVSAPLNYWKLVPGFTYKNLNEELAVWDSRYHDLDLNSNTFSDLLKEGVRSAETGITTDRFVMPDDFKSLDAYYSVAQFKDVSYLNFFELSFAFPTTELFNQSNNGDSLNFEAAIMIYDSDLNPVFHMVKNYDKTSALSVNSFSNLFIDKFEIPLKTGEYYISFDIYVPKRKMFFAAKFKENIINFESKKLQCSSLEQAFSISSDNDPGAKDKKHLRIIPNPTKRFDQKKNIYTYYEIYNLEKGKDDLCHYDVSVNIQRKEGGGILSFFTGLFSSNKYNLSISDSFMDTTSNITNYQAFDMSQLEKGEYTMKLTVKDDINNEEVSTSSDITIE